MNAHHTHEGSPPTIPSPPPPRPHNCQRHWEQLSLLCYTYRKCTLIGRKKKKQQRGSDPAFLRLRSTALHNIILLFSFSIPVFSFLFFSPQLVHQAGGAVGRETDDYCSSHRHQADSFKLLDQTRDDCLITRVTQKHDLLSILNGHSAILSLKLLMMSDVIQ